MKNTYAYTLLLSLLLLLFSCTADDIPDSTPASLSASKVARSTIGFTARSGAGLFNSRVPSVPYSRDTISNSHSLKYTFTTSDGGYLMGSGSFIHPQVIMTAAHVVVGNESFIKGKTITIYYKSKDVADKIKAIDVKVRDLKMHPSYGTPLSPYGKYGDMALILLESPLTDVETLKIPTQDQISSIAYGTIIHFSHISYLFSDAYEFGRPRVLAKAPPTKLPYKPHEAIMSISYLEKKKNRIIGGDSGGSWYYYFDGEPYSVGIVSNADLFFLPSHRSARSFISKTLAKWKIDSQDIIESGIKSITAISSTDSYTAYYDLVANTFRREAVPNSPSRVLDGQEGTFWEPKGLGKDQWLQIEFKRPKSIKGYSIGRSGTTNSKFPYKWKLLASNDGATWTQIHQYEGRYYYPVYRGDPKISKFYASTDPVSFYIENDNSTTYDYDLYKSYTHYRFSFDTEYGSKKYWIHNVRIGTLEFF